jgi:hypothetical protein
MTEYCYSADEEFYHYESIGDLIDHIKRKTDTPIGATYWRGEKAELTHADCIDVESILERCDEMAYEEIGEIYDNCFTDVTDQEKRELEELIVTWAKKCVNMRYLKVVNVQELKLTAEDLK